MNEDEPPAQTDLHKHGMLIKDQLYNNMHLSGEIKGSLPNVFPAKRSEMSHKDIRFLLFHVQRLCL